MNIRTVGVLGAGVMGTGLAQNLLESRHRVVLVDVSVDILQRARRDVVRALRLRRFSDRNAAPLDVAAVEASLVTSVDYAPLAEADFVIENVTEKWEVKRRVYERIDALCDTRAVFAANTSAIPITLIASATTRPDRVIGMHFMNPVPLKRLIEVIAGRETSPDTVEAARQVAAALGKECVIVNDSPGFVSNRVLMLAINEAIALVGQKVARPEDVDRIFRGCFGHTMGPLETADLIGLDVILLSLEVLREQFNDPKFRPAPLLCTLVSAGRLGRKSGSGFYSYTVEDRRSPEPLPHKGDIAHV